MLATDVLADTARWHVEPADNLPWLQSLPEGGCSLTLTSPPYETARRYGQLAFRKRGQEWVDWMAPRVVAMCRATQGLVCVNMAGQLQDSSYSPVVEWLVADLTRNHGLVCGPAPYCYFRFSIPGSGGKHYHRRDWEPVYCFARPECLPLAWSNNTACGHPPKWAPGGEMSNRLSDGTRVNQWGRTGGSESGGSQGADGKRQRKSRPSHQIVSTDAATGNLFGQETPSTRLVSPDGRVKRRTPQVTTGADGSVVERDDAWYDPPAIANPGNVVRESYDAEQVRALFEDLVTGRIDSGDVLRCLVGGSQMGSALAHQSEAPFSEKLASFFVRSYAPPGSIVCDPFCGSGTTGAVAVRLGRRFLGCDLRPNQVAIASQRISAETPDLFGGQT